MKYLIIVAGPTASGKTALGIRLAKHFKTVILSADSRQFYREMNIGTAKPTLTEQAQAKHYFINNLSIWDNYSVGQYEREAIPLLEKLYQQHDVVLMVGGSGFFIKAVCEGLSKYPKVPSQIRKDLELLFQKEGIIALQQELQQADPTYFAQVDKNNPQRLIRALEVCRASGQPFSSFQKPLKVNRCFTPIMIVCTWERAVLYDRINHRVDLMLAAGQLEEARLLYPHKHLNALQTVGYQEFFDYFDKKIPLEEAIRLVKRNTRRYAKRQVTWFKNSTNGKAFHPSEWEDILVYLEGRIKN